MAAAAMGIGTLTHPTPAQAIDLRGGPNGLEIRFNHDETQALAAVVAAVAGGVVGTTPALAPPLPGIGGVVLAAVVSAVTSYLVEHAVPPDQCLGITVSVPFLTLVPLKVWIEPCSLNRTG